LRAETNNNHGIVAVQAFIRMAAENVAAKLLIFLGISQPGVNVQKAEP
jgi:hypothetical protein